MIRILTWLWRQEKSIYTYTAEDVNIWASMVRRHVTIPHRLACVTNIPKGIDSSVEIIPLPDVLDDLKSGYWPARRGFPQCWRRLHMWHPEAAKWYGERFVSMDLDCVVTGNLDAVFSRTEDVILYEGRGRKFVYNGSLQMLTAGARPEVWERLCQDEVTAASQHYRGSDQAYLGWILGPDEATWTRRDGVYWYSVREFPAPVRNKRALARSRRAFPNQVADPKPPDGMRLLFFPGRYKPRDLKGTYPFIAQHYH